jgi:putative transposase
VSIVDRAREIQGVSAEDEQKTRAERARAIGLFRYQLIREAADQVHSTKQRGRLVRAIAAAEHTDPFGRRVRVSRQTVDRWIRDWRAGGFDALVPNPRQSSARTPAEVMELAVGLRRENPDRTAAGIRRILRAQLGWSPDERTLQRHFTRLGLNRSAGTVTSVFGRFEAERPNDLWTGDALHGIHIGGRKTYLFAFIDDHSRAIVGYRFGFAEDTVRLAAALRPALAARGVPQAIYVDNGSAFVDAWLLRACASLGIKLTHSTPGRPQGRGKIERFFRTVRDQFHARDRRRARRRRTSCGGRSAGAEPVVRRVGRNQLSPRGAFRDRATAPGPLAGRWPVPAAEAGGADRGVFVGGTTDRHENRHGVAARQRLSGRRGTGWEEG